MTYYTSLLAKPSNNTSKHHFTHKIKVKYNGPVSQLLGIKFTHITHPDGNLSIYMNQTAYVDHLIKELGLDGPNVNCTTVPHCQGYLMDKIPVEKYDAASNSNTSN